MSLDYPSAILPLRTCVLAEFNRNATRLGLAQHRPHGIWWRPPAPLHFCFLLLLILKKGLDKGIKAGQGFTQNISVMMITHKYKTINYIAILGFIILCT